MLKDNAEKISPADKSRLEAAANVVKEALKGDEIAAIKTASEKLNDTWQAVSTELYKTATEKAGTGRGPAGGPAGNPPGADDGADSHQKNEEPVVDAEVVDEMKAA
jgi:molecular chaperone DnaK